MQVKTTNVICGNAHVGHPLDAAEFFGDRVVARAIRAVDPPAHARNQELISTRINVRCRLRHDALQPFDGTDLLQYRVLTFDFHLAHAVEHCVMACEEAREKVKNQVDFDIMIGQCGAHHEERVRCLIDAWDGLEWLSVN